jgi:aspartyl protease family protein
MLFTSCKAGLVSLLLCAVAINSASAQSATETAESRLAALMERLSVKLPLLVTMRPSIRKPLDELVREPCDRKAIADLGNALEKEGYRREAANAHVRFSETCKGHALSLQTAANILINLSDYDAAATVASRLIELVPFGDNGYYLRAVAHDRGGQHRQAIDDYVTAIELFGAKDRISSVSYVGMARNQEKLGQFCDAALAIEAWVALNPARNDTSQTRAMIANYRSKGSCVVATKIREAVIPITRRGHVVTLSAILNGVTGTFILDTGATFVALTHDFAQRAKVDVDRGSTIKVNTANGIAEVHRARAKSIRVRTLEAQDVPIVVQANQKAGFGARTDGLLGMSFLSRFTVSMDASSVRIRPRAAR